MKISTIFSLMRLYTFKIEKENRNNDDIRPAWRILVDLPKKPFLMEDYTLIVSDRDKKSNGYARSKWASSI